MTKDEYDVQVVINSFNQKVDSAQHREGWSGSVTDVLGVIKGNACLHHALHTLFRCMQTLLSGD